MGQDLNTHRRFAAVSSCKSLASFTIPENGKPARTVDGLVHDLKTYTLVSWRWPGDAHWRVSAIEGERNNFGVDLAAFQKVEFSCLGELHLVPEYLELAQFGLAKLKGWSCISGSSSWVQLEEPFPLSRAELTPVEISFELVQVINGWMSINVKFEGEKIELVLNDVEDSLVLWARFAACLKAGGEPHAFLADDLTTWFAVRVLKEREQCHLRIVRTGRGKRVFDLALNRRCFAAAFRKLMLELAEHPWLGHMWLCFGSLGHPEYDDVEREAEADWQKLLDCNIVEDDWDAQEEFVARRVVERVQLPSSCDEFSARTRRMLRSLEIPAEWLH